MQTNNHKIVDYDAVLDAKFGKDGTPERARAEEAPIRSILARYFRMLAKKLR